MSKNIKNKILDIVISFAAGDDVDVSDALFTLHNSIANESISRIHILSESSREVVENFLMCHEIKTKLVIVENGHRPTIYDLLIYINNLFDSDSVSYVALAKGGIAFSSNEAIHDAISILADDTSTKNTVLAITRTCNSLGSLPYDICSLTDYSSADAWIFGTKVFLKTNPTYYLDDHGCDLKFICGLTDFGYRLLNPCLDALIISRIGTDPDRLCDNNFPGDGNSTCRSPSTPCLGETPNFNIRIPWNKKAWINAGYLPETLRDEKACGLWVFLHGDHDHERTRLLVAALDCLAHYHGRDLYLVVAQKHLDNLVWAATESLKVNSRIYLIPTENTDLAFSNLFTENNGCKDSIIYSSAISSINMIMLNEYDRICIRVDCAHDDDPIVLNSTWNLGGFDLNIALEQRYYGQFKYGANFIQLATNQIKCTLVTSLFRSDEYVSTFLKNCADLVDYSDNCHIFVVSQLSGYETMCLLSHFKDNKNIVVVWNKTDPGLYESWNTGTRLSATEYVSNANADDLRDPRHLKELIEVLDSDKSLGFAACALYPFYEYSGDITKHRVGVPWYSDQAGHITFRDLATLEMSSPVAELKAHNLPHCMPVWRRSLHDAYGYFQENIYGTYADWAFWLKVTLNGEKGYLLGKGLGYYYVNLASHNRRGAQLLYFHRRIEREFLPHFLLDENTYKHLRTDPGASTFNPEGKSSGLPQENILAQCDTADTNINKKLDLYGIELCYGQHRNDFGQLIKSLLPLHCGPGGVIFLPFIERYFVWGDTPGEAASATPTPLTQSWIGIVHVPFDAPPWFGSSVYPEVIFESELWKKSLPYCKGLISLSEDLRRDLSIKYPDIPTLALKFPTEFSNLKYFDVERFLTNKRVVQVGDWLRKLQAVYQIDAPGYQKIILKKLHTDTYLNNDIKVFGDLRNNSVTEHTMIPNDQYDDLLCSSVVLCMMYATAANNLVLECIARTTPIIVNSLPSVVEYLGEDYPLYADDITEAGEKLHDVDLIVSAHHYLRDNMPRLISELSYDKFCKALYESDFYKNL